MISPKLDYPLVTCIIIFLNGEDYIEKTIASIFAQTYEHWELLLVDDGSTDGSTTIAQRYAQQYPNKVRYLEHEGHENRGMSATRNLGIGHAKGTYIAFLDADDIWVPEKLTQQVDILARHPATAMVYGRTQIWYSWTGRPEDQALDHCYELGVSPNTIVQPPMLLIQLLQNKYQTPTTCNALMRRSIFEDIGQFEPAFRTMYEDQVFFAKVLLHVPVFVADHCWAKYRQHAQSCSSLETAQGKNQGTSQGTKSQWSLGAAATYYAKRQPFLTWLQDYLAHQSIQDDRVWAAFHWEQWQCQHPRLAYWLSRVPFPLRTLARLVSVQLFR